MDWINAVDPGPPQDASSRARWIEDKVLVGEAIHRLMTLIDQRLWAQVQDCFDTRVYVDYTALRPQPSAGWFESRALVAGWKARYDAIPAYQHHIGNLVCAVEGDAARCAGSNITTHQRPDATGAATELWQVGAYHRWQLGRLRSRWLITHIAARKLWERVEPAGPAGSVQSPAVCG